MTTEALPIDQDWVTVDNRSLYTITCRPKTSPPLATVTVVHGFGEHIDRYQALFQFFASRGIAVHGFDQRGFGKTGRKNGSLGHNEGYVKVLEDVSAANARIRVEGVPHFLFGHSMGGLNVLMYASLYGTSQNIAGVISSGPALKVDPSVEPGPVTYYSASMLCKVFPTFKMSTNLVVEKLTRNSQVVEEYKSSHYNYDIGSLRTLKDLLDNAKKLLNEYAKTFSLPVFMSHGEMDGITHPDGTKQFFDQIPDSVDKTLRIYEGCYHELHFEPESEQIMNDYVDWILKRVPTTTTTPRDTA